MPDPLDEARRLAESGRHKKAIEACREASEAPQAERRELMARSHEALGEYAKAAEALQRAAGASGDPALLCRAGELWRISGSHAKAAKAAGEALKITPGDPRALAAKALALVCLDRHSEALECCGPDPADPHLQAAAGRALYETGKTAEAARLCKQACSSPGFAARFYAGLALGRQEGSEYMEAALAEPFETDSPAARKAAALWWLGRTGELLKLGNSDDPKAACIAGLALEEAGRKEAESAFRRAAGCKTQNCEDMYHAALACHRLGLAGDMSWHQKAAKTAKRAMGLNAGYPGLAELARESGARASGRRAEAEKDLAERARAAAEKKEPQKPRRPAPARKTRPKRRPEAPAPAAPDPAVMVSDAMGMCVPGRCAEALDALAALPAPAQKRADAQFCKGTAYYGLGKYEEAATCFERADSAGPSQERAYWHAKALYRQGLSGLLDIEHTQKVQCYRGAQRLLARVLSADPLHPGARTLAGLVENNSAQSIKTASREDAERSLREALRADGSDTVALYHLAQMRENAGDMAEARGLYERAIAAPVGASGFECDPLYCRGYALDLQGQHESALTTYLEALARDPEHGPDFADRMRLERGKEAPRAPRRGRPEVCVVDTNVALPHLVRSFLSRDVPDWSDLTWHRRHFWKGIEDGSYLIPPVCAREIMQQLYGGLLQRCVPGERPGPVITGVREKLEGLPRTRWTEMAAGVTAQDVARVRRAYWGAWFRMSPQKKEQWVEKKRKGGRRLEGGPPLGTYDTKILATAAKLASGGKRIGLITNDNDFLMFEDVAGESGVQIVKV